MAKATADIRSLARAHTDQAVKTLVGIMNQPKSPCAARVAAAKELIDRGWGKPDQTQNINVTRRMEELTDQEIATRIAELRGIGASSDDAEAPIGPGQLN